MRTPLATGTSSSTITHHPLAVGSSRITSATKPSAISGNTSYTLTSLPRRRINTKMAHLLLTTRLPTHSSVADANEFLMNSQDERPKLLRRERGIDPPIPDEEAEVRTETPRTFRRLIEGVGCGEMFVAGQPDVGAHDRPCNRGAENGTCTLTERPHFEGRPQGRGPPGRWLHSRSAQLFFVETGRFIQNSSRIHRRVLYFLTQPTVSDGLNPSARRRGGCAGLQGPPTQEAAIEGTATVPIHGGFEN
jgi:hypothetical protein